MIRFVIGKDYGYKDGKQLVKAKLECDEIDELPAVNFFEGKLLDSGSQCWVIGTGDLYGLTSTGDWVKVNFMGNGEGGGGGGGTSDYPALNSKPKINGVTLIGDKTSSALGLQSELTFDSVPTVNSTNPLTSDGIYRNCVQKESGKSLSTNDYTTAEKSKLTNIQANAQVNIIECITVNGTEILPANKTVALQLLTKAVSDLENYYLKTETYTKEEVNSLINDLTSLSFEIVARLPVTDISANTIYLINMGDNAYMQYMYINSEWAQLGTTSVDLANYYTKAQVNTFLNGKQNTLIFDSVPTSMSTNPVTSGGVFNALAEKQNSLTWDSAPAENSFNPVTSGGVFTALAGKQNSLTFDTVPTANSQNPVTSDGIYSSLTEKQNALTFDTVPTSGSVNPVTSGGILTALNEKQNMLAVSQITVSVPHGGIKLVKYGKIVQASFQVVTNDTPLTDDYTSGSWTELGNSVIPLAYRPLITTYIGCSLVENPILFRVLNTGSLQYFWSGNALGYEYEWSATWISAS